MQARHTELAREPKIEHVIPTLLTEVRKEVIFVRNRIPSEKQVFHARQHVSPSSVPASLVSGEMKGVSDIGLDFTD